MTALAGRAFYVTGSGPNAANHIDPHGVTLIAVTWGAEFILCSGRNADSLLVLIGALHAIRPIFPRCEALFATPFARSIFAPKPQSI